jgi:hypothetical protein
MAEPIPDFRLTTGIFTNMNCKLSHLKTKKMISDISPELLLLLADVEEQVAFEKTLPNAVQEQSVRTKPDNWVA